MKNEAKGSEEKMTTIETCVAAIAAQQDAMQNKGAGFGVGEVLKEICGRDAAAAEIVLQDLSVPEMSLEKAGSKLYRYAESHKSGNSFCVLPDVAEKLIREFYALGAVPASEAQAKAAEPMKAAAGRHINLLDFL